MPILGSALWIWYSVTIGFIGVTLPYYYPLPQGTYKTTSGPKSRGSPRLMGAPGGRPPRVSRRRLAPADRAHHPIDRVVLGQDRSAADAHPVERSQGLRRLP